MDPRTHAAMIMGIHKAPKRRRGSNLKPWRRAQGGLPPRAANPLGLRIRMSRQVHTQGGLQTNHGRTLQVLQLAEANALHGLGRIRFALLGFGNGITKTTGLLATEGVLRTLQQTAFFAVTPQHSRPGHALQHAIVPTCQEQTDEEHGDETQVAHTPVCLSVGFRSSSSLEFPSILPIAKPKDGL